LDENGNIKGGFGYMRKEAKNGKRVSIWANWKNGQIVTPSLVAIKTEGCQMHKEKHLLFVGGIQEKPPNHDSSSSSSSSSQLFSLEPVGQGAILTEEFSTTAIWKPDIHFFQPIKNINYIKKNWTIPLFYKDQLVSFHLNMNGRTLVSSVIMFFNNKGLFSSSSDNAQQQRPIFHRPPSNKENQHHQLLEHLKTCSASKHNVTIHQTMIQPPPPKKAISFYKGAWIHNNLILDMINENTCHSRFSHVSQTKPSGPYGFGTFFIRDEYTLETRSRPNSKKPRRGVLYDKTKKKHHLRFVSGTRHQASFTKHHHRNHR